MKKILGSVAFLAAVLAAFMAGQWYASFGGEVLRLSPRATTGSEEFALGDVELAAVEARARLGDVTAMQKLHLHYAFHESNDSRAKFWERAMADAGDTFSQSTVLKMYLTSSDARERKEGASLCAEWLEKPLAKQAD